MLQDLQSSYFYVFNNSLDSAIRSGALLHHYPSKGRFRSGILTHITVVHCENQTSCNEEFDKHRRSILYDCANIMFEMIVLKQRSIIHLPFLNHESWFMKHNEVLMKFGFPFTTTGVFTGNTRDPGKDSIIPKYDFVLLNLHL